MTKLTLRKIGNSYGFILPREILHEMEVKEGEAVYLTRGPDGNYRLSPYDPEFETWMQEAEEIMSEYRNALRELAK